MKRATLRLAAFVSGRGSNLEAIVHAIDTGSLDACVALVLSSTSEAGALDFARSRGIPAATIPKKKEGPEARTRFILDRLEENNITFIALAGYMHLVEAEVIHAYMNRIVNIHPALLPSFGGQGMYGHHVHEAVIASGAMISGATVHLVNEEYDRGPIVTQRAVPVLPGDTPDDLAARVLKAEHTLYAETLQLFAEGQVHVTGTTAKITGTLPAYYLK